MNHEIINEKTDLLCYRLRTARQRKRMARKGFEKKLRALGREENRLYTSKGELGWIDINPPVQRGWKRHFVLRDDIARSKDSVFFQGILDKINTTDYSNRKDFKIKHRDKGKKVYALKPQRLRNLKEVNFKKVSFTEKELNFFEEQDVLDWTGKKFYKALVFVQAWHFVLRIKPNIITKTRVRDEAIESRLAEINNHLERRNLRPMLTNMQGRSYRGRWRKEEEKAKEMYLFKSTPLPQILDLAKEY